MKTYLAYLIITVAIEIVGRGMLQLWSYPHLSSAAQVIHVFVIGYPFAFFLIFESYKLLKKVLKSTTQTIIITTLISASIHEIPNIFAWEWKYTIPFIRFEILQVNIVVIIGWIILVLIPLFVDDFLKHEGKFHESKTFQLFFKHHHSDK